MKLSLSSKTKALAFAVVMTASSAAMAQDPPADPNQPPTQPPPGPIVSSGVGMGGQGQIVIAADIPFLTTSPVFSIVRSSTNMNGGSATDIVIAPSADYFVAPNVSVGALLGLSMTSVTGGDVTTFGLMPRVGYSLSLTDVLSIWPRIGIGYVHTSVSGGGGSGYVIPMLIEAPILWHPATHFFLGAGPMLSLELVDKATIAGTSMDQPKTTNFGITTMIGGYFGGP